MGAETNLWLIRHAPVDGPRGIIHGPDAPADTSDAAAFAALKAKLPPNAFAVCSPARRAWETAIALGLHPAKEAAFREQDFGAWTGRRHNDLVAELGDAYRDFWKSPASNRPPGGALRFVIDPLSLTRIDRLDNGWRVVAVNQR